MGKIMKLILLRHALQESSAVDAGESPKVTLKGKKQQHSTNQYLLENGLRPSCVYTSPLKRAVETAEIVGECFSCPVVVENALVNNFREEVLLRIIQNESHESICFIGHAPTLPDFARFLVGEIPVPDIGRSSALVLDVERAEEKIHCHPILYVTPDGVMERFEVSPGE